MALQAHVATSQGGRQYMEDTHLLPTAIGPPRGNTCVMGVFDGHGGSAVAKTCSANFAQILHQCLMRQPADPAIALRDSFRLVDELARIADTPMVGSTAVLCLRHGGRLWFANAGDSMAMIIYANGSCAFMSQEHKADSERERIEAAGGRITYHDGMGRVNGGLNLARSIGDHYVKRYVHSDPYVRSVPCTKEVQFVVMASDGIWDVYDPPELTAEILHAMSTTDSWEEALKRVVQSAHARMSFDNVTLMVVPLQAPNATA